MNYFTMKSNAAIFTADPYEQPEDDRPRCPLCDSLEEECDCDCDWALCELVLWSFETYEYKTRQHVADDDDYDLTF